MVSKRSLLLGLTIIFLAGVLTWQLATAQNNVTIRGIVLNADGPVAGAVVRNQASSTSTTTDIHGHFELNIPSDGATIITAWIPGYIVGWTEVDSESKDATIELKQHYTTDNPAYEWFSFEGDSGSLSCSHCMPAYNEWIEDAHSQSAINPRFLSLYNGTSLMGQRGAPTSYHFDPDTGIEIPVAPSLGQDEVGPGFRLDFPDLGGNCATCHMPGAVASLEGGYHVDINNIAGIALDGVFCEFCHKVGEVALDQETLLPEPERPGVLSMRLYRPEPDSNEQIFFGNLDDVNRRVTYLPLLSESAFCAPCHSGTFWGTTIYDSYGEWLTSPYSDPETGQTCQDCHMPQVDYNFIVYPDKGGLERDGRRNLSHRMLGATNETLLSETADLQVSTRRDVNQLQITVEVTNSGAGHHIPTDSPLRNIILLVNVYDTNGDSVSLLTGPVIPETGGIGDPQDGYYAGLPGVLYAKVLQDFYTGEYPSYAYWRQTNILSDNRIPALGTDHSTYAFDLSQTRGPYTVDVQLILRRAFIELMDLKAWNTMDILMEHETVVIE
jgi:mono/diheme cytochrome c family protein